MFVFLIKSGDGNCNPVVPKAATPNVSVTEMLTDNKNDGVQMHGMKIYSS